MTEKCNLFLLGKDFIPIYMFSRFSSFTWTDRYDTPGTFSLTTLFDQKLYDLLKIGMYLQLEGTETIMILESITIQFDTKQNLTIVIGGRSSEIILERRIIWGEWATYEGEVPPIIGDPDLGYPEQPEIDQSQPLEEYAESLINSEVINPEDERRKIPIIGVRKSGDPEIDKLTITASGEYDNLYEVIQSMAKVHKLGFHLVYFEKDDKLYFEFYRGIDRSLEQEDVEPVIFSGDYGNLVNARYVFDTKDFKTMALVKGPDQTVVDEWGNEITDENGETKTEFSLLSVGIQNVTGLERREIFVDASEDLLNSMVQKGMEELLKANTLQLLDAEMDARRQFVYKRDFFIGDIVQVITQFGLDMQARVTEFMRCWDENGYSEVPTFEFLEENVYGT